MMDWNGGWGWGNWLAMSLMMLVFWGAVIWLVVTLVRGSNRGGTSTAAPRSAEDLLAERFARGEIDEAEYQERLRVLRGGQPGQPPRLDKTGAGR